MDFQPDFTPNKNAITQCDAAGLAINRQPWAQGVIIHPDQPPVAIDLTDVQALPAALLESVLALAPEVVIIGTGARHVFPAPERLAPLYRAGVGVEIMSSDAAARTYNVLMSEHRHVVALIIHPTQGAL